MLSAVAKKIVQQSQLIWEKKLCLRSRLRGFSCRKCVEICAHQALTDTSGEIIYDQNKCTGCGSCVAVCSNGSFSFEGLDIQKEVERTLTLPNLIVSCRKCDYIADNEVRIPCVGIVTEELLVSLGLKRQHALIFNLTECATCHNHLSAKMFWGKLQHVQKNIGHLFRAQILACRSVDDLPKPKQPDRRGFLLNLGGNAADIVRNQFETVGTQTQRPEKSRRIPTRVQVLVKLLQDQELYREELFECCLPALKVSDECNLCPRCTGMCPTGALKVRREKNGKSLFFDRHLCSACGLCVEFCKVRAISMNEAIIRLDMVKDDSHTISPS